MNTKRPTIIDVAKQAAVSKSTVSLVLQNSPLVKEDTRELVRASMLELGYVYNRTAAKMRTDRNGLVGLVINDLRNPFFTEFATSLQMAMAERGFSTVIANTDENPIIQEQVIASMIEHGVSALIISPAYGPSEKLFSDIKRANVPTFQVLRQLSSDVAEFPFFSFDYENGGRLACQHLLEKGCKNIAFIGGNDGSAITEERMKGYLEIVKTHHMEAKIFLGKPSKEFGQQAAKDIIANHPQIDGCFCFNDLVALGMASGFASRNVKLGSEMLLVGFDDIEDCRHSFPSLTSINCEIADFGRSVAKSLLDWLTEGIKPRSIYRAPVALSARASTNG